jgi:hypothetical protein
MFFAVFASAVASMHLVFNEQTKLTATWLNALATALMAAGLFAPAAALAYGLSAPLIRSVYVFILMFGCIGGSIGLHMLGRVVLGRLRE